MSFPIEFKIIYYGPDNAGKTTNLKYLSENLPSDKIIDFRKTDNFFDLLILKLGKIKDRETKIKIFALPGAPRYNSTRKVILKNTIPDGIVIVFDSQKEKLEENKKCLNELIENLNEINIDLNNFPCVFQFNKRDLDNIFSVDELKEIFSPFAKFYIPAIANKGEGIMPTLKKVTELIINQKYSK